MFERSPYRTVNTACSTCFDIKSENFACNVSILSMCFSQKQINFLNTFHFFVSKTLCVVCDVSEMLNIIQTPNGVKALFSNCV